MSDIKLFRLTGTDLERAKPLILQAYDGGHDAG